MRRIAVAVPAESAEAARAAFLDLAPLGFEERDLGELLELAVYADDAEPVLERFPDAVVSDVPGDWATAWRAFHRPVVVGGLWVGPPWEPAAADHAAVVIDPGLAFGTGSHPTTRLCLDLLAGIERGSLLDVGCGSGVLAIAAVRLGFQPVTAVDVDPVAVATTEQNAAANGVTVGTAVVDAVSGELPVADVALANVLLGPVEAILPRLDARVAVTSGYLAGERPRHPGWAHVRSAELDGWAADVLARTG